VQHLVRLCHSDTPCAASVQKPRRLQVFDCLFSSAYGGAGVAAELLYTGRIDGVVL
jgi:hypothetical protein